MPPAVYDPREVVTQLSLASNDVDVPANGRISTALPKYLRSRKGLVPSYLLPRFHAMAKVFQNSHVDAVTRHARSCMPPTVPPKYAVETHRLIERTFRLGARDANLIILLKQVDKLSECRDPWPAREKEIETYPKRGAKAKSSYRIASSLVYYGSVFFIFRSALQQG
ncbi:hypothetical protein NMY22_g19110 [Coprinellus aureogranulatus]|nr:hypothetical protein NMY22_g19110 [Coprinellus aureogranulatus]